MRQLVLRVASVLLALACAVGGAGAAEAPTVGEDPALEQHVNRIGEELRCLVCQNQTISDSHAGLAIDLKNQIREQLKAGRGEREIMAFMVQRYGDFVLYRPPLKATTWLLWAGPFALLALGAGVAVVVVRGRRGAGAASPLTEGQRHQAAALLRDEPEILS
jgi:cytochrome c-type biogenesis protein CcmH